MKILLINPPPQAVVEPYYDQPEFPRTALACLAGYLRDRNIDVHIMDCKFDRVNYDEGLERVRSLEPDIVGFTAFTNEIKPAAHLAKLIKQENSYIKTLIGGVHVTALAESTMREFPEFDYGIVGEGELSLYEMISNYGDQAALARTPGVCFLDSQGQYIFGGERAKLDDQDSLPMPAWDLFRPAKEYMPQTLRGCPFACDFCMNPNGRTVRPRSPQNVLDEVQFIIENYHPESIFFGDEIFTINRERSMAICQGMIDRGFHEKVKWWCQTHVRTIDLELVQLMKDSGCKLVGLGIESGDDEKLKAMGKGTSLKNIEDAIKVLKQANLSFSTFFILGQPNETYESALETIDLAVRLSPVYPVFGIMVPYPGTKIAEMARKGEGGYVLLSDDWAQYNKQFGNALAFKDLSRKQLERLQFLGYLKVYIWNFRFIDLMKFIWKYQVEGVALIKKQINLAVKDIHFFFPFSPKQKK